MSCCRSSRTQFKDKKQRSISQEVAGTANMRRAMVCMSGRVLDIPAHQSRMSKVFEGATGGQKTLHTVLLKEKISLLPSPGPTCGQRGYITHAVSGNAESTRQKTSCTQTYPAPSPPPFSPLVFPHFRLFVLILAPFSLVPLPLSPRVSPFCPITPPPRFPLPPISPCLSCFSVVYDVPGGIPDLGTLLPCSRVPERSARGRKSQMALTPAISGAHVWAKWLYHPCCLGVPNRSARGQKSEMAI